jgi:WD40 repeat protein
VNGVELTTRMLTAHAHASETLHGLTGGVRMLSTSGDLLACASRDGAVRLFGLRSCTCFAELIHPDWPGAVDFSPDGELLATGCDDAKVRIFPVDGGRAGPCRLLLRGESSSWIVGVAWCGARLLSCSRDSEVALWATGSAGADAPSAPLATCFTRPVSTPGSRSSRHYTCFAAWGGTAVAGGADQALHRYACAEAGLVASGPIAGHHGPVHALAFDKAAAELGSGDATGGGSPAVLASGGSGGSVQLWDLRAASCACKLPGSGEGGATRALALSGSLLLASTDASPTIFAWDLRAPRIVARLRGHTNNDALALDAERGRVVSGGRMNELRLWATTF